MRILYVTQIVPYPPHGGVLQRGFNLLRQLGRDHDVHLIAFRHRDEMPTTEHVDASKRALAEFCRRVEYVELWPKRSMVHRLAGLGFAALHPSPFSFIAHRSRLLATRIASTCTGSVRPDIVHLDTVALAPYAKQCGRVPVVLAHHNIESTLMSRRAEFERKWSGRWYVNREARKLRHEEARAAHEVCANIAVSEADAEALRLISPGARVDVVPNGVDVDYFTPRSHEESPTLVFTGGMGMFANRDGIDWFLDAIWPAVKARVPAARLVVVGRFPTSRLLETASRDRSVEAPGFQPDVRPAVSRAAVVIVPLRVGGGTRLKVLDAMAQGKAIVSTSLGAEGLDVSDGVHIAIADAAGEFAERIVALLASPDARRRLGEAARMRAVEVYSWSELALRLVSVYTRVIAEQHK